MIVIQIVEQHSDHLRPILISGPLLACGWGKEWAQIIRRRQILIYGCRTVELLVPKSRRGGLRTLHPTTGESGGLRICHGRTINRWRSIETEQ